jgi:hypothetical protein
MLQTKKKYKERKKVLAYKHGCTHGDRVETQQEIPVALKQRFWVPNRFQILAPVFGAIKKIGFEN